MTSTKGQPLPPALRNRLAAFVERNGEKAAIDQLGIPRNTLSRCLAGLPCYSGTHALVAARLAEVA
jgi:hypothetical protein